MESVTYKVTYLGTEAGISSLLPDRSSITTAGLPGKVLPYAVGILGVGAVAILGVLLFRSRRALRQFQDEESDEIEEEEPK